MAASGTSPWTPAGCCWRSWSPRPAPRTATAGRRLLWRLRRHFPTIRLVWADAGYAGKLIIWAQQALTLTLQIVRKRQGVHHFEVLPRRWVVERVRHEAP